MMVPLNASIVNVSLPTISTFFNIGIGTAEWVLTVYFITFLGLVLFFARFGDFYGHERLFLMGLVGFVISSLMCSLAPSILALIIFRGLQGVTAAMVLSVSMVIIERSFPIRYFGKAFGFYSVAIAAGLAFGPVIGGIMDGLIGWRAIFLVNIPIGIIDLFICYFTLRPGKRIEVKWDIPGTLVEFVALFLTIYTLSLVSDANYGQAVVTAILAVISVVIFAYIELHADKPLLNLKLFKNKIFSAFNVTLHFNYICVYGILFAMPYFLQKVLYLDPLTTGLVLTASPLMMMVMAPLSGAVSDKFGSVPPIIVSSVICSISMLSLTQLTPASTPEDVFLRLAVFGVGTALFQAPVNKILMSVFPSGTAGTASGVIATVRDMGMVFAVCYAGLLITSAIPSDLLLQSQLFAGAAQQLTMGIHRVVIFGAILSASIAVIALVGIKNKKKSVLEYEHKAINRTLIFKKRLEGK